MLIAPVPLKDFLHALALLSAFKADTYFPLRVEVKLLTLALIVLIEARKTTIFKDTSALAAPTAVPSAKSQLIRMHCYRDFLRWVNRLEIRVHIIVVPSILDYASLDLNLVKHHPC